MFDALAKWFSFGRDKTSRSEIKTKDRYGNDLTICAKCKVPVVVQGAVIKCLNGCHIGDVDYIRDERSSEQNNYNPLQIKMCSKCGGDGKEYFKEDDTWCAIVCEQCNGQGVFHLRKYSVEDEQALACVLPLDVNVEGWARCPKCNFQFQVSDKNVWLDGRHKRCGQKLSLPENYASL